MALVLLRAPLSELAGGRELALDGGTVKEALIALESSRPAVAGWVLDERRRDPRARQRLRQRSARAGGRRRSARPTGSTSCPRSREGEMTEILVGTKKGLFVLEGDVEQRVRGDGARLPGPVGRVRDARPALGTLPRLRHVVVLRWPDLGHRRPGR